MDTTSFQKKVLALKILKMQQDLERKYHLLRQAGLNTEKFEISLIDLALDVYGIPQTSDSRIDPSQPEYYDRGKFYNMFYGMDYLTSGNADEGIRKMVEFIERCANEHL